MDLEYRDGDQRCLGVLALPDEARFPGKRPGIVAVHEAWGLGDQVKRRVRMLADLGYVALAADIFGDRHIPADPPEAFRIIDAFADDPKRLRQRAAAAVQALAAQQRCDGRIAAIGYCFGGRTVLELARSGHADLLGVVSFHGALDSKSPAQKGEVRARILACHGAEDQFVPRQHLEAFLDEMAAAEADCQTIAYSGVVHGFTNPEADGSFNPSILYHQRTDRRSWLAMQAHLAELFA